MSVLKSSSRELNCKDLHGYLRTLQTSVLDRLYNHPATCLAVYRDLPNLAQQYVMRILFVETAVAKSVISSWVQTQFQNEHQEASKVLSDLRIWHESSLPGGLHGWKLNEIFRHNLKVALLGGGNAWHGSGALSSDKYSKDVEYLDNYAVERWECILHYMVGSREGAGGISKDMIDVLLYSGLMKSEKVGEDAQITPSGFQFLLMDTASQVWFFMLQYLETAESRGLDQVDTLSFLFQLNFFTLGKDYSTEGLSDNHQRFLQHLRELGLVYQRKRSSQRFYPTRLALNLATGVSTGAVETPRQGFLVVETNYRVYAYTDSPLMIALLALFASLEYRFPGMVVAVISRDSVREALFRGITAEQIINFLRSHVHPEMLKEKPVLPPTISDVIRLWELERDRFKFSEGVLYNQFLSQTDFELLRNYARDLGVLVWENPDKRNMVVTRGGHDDVKKYWKRHKNDT